MLKNFFSRKFKAFFCGGTSTLIGASLVSTYFLNTEAVKVRTLQEGFVKSKTFSFLNHRVKKESIDNLESIWKWGEDNLLKFLEKSYSYFGVAVPKTRLEKLLVLLKFAEKNSEENENWEYAKSLVNQCRGFIDANAGELLVEYFENKSLEELTEIRAFEKWYSKVNEKDFKIKAEVYKRLYSFSVTLNERISEYCKDFISFCSIDEESEGAKELNNKIYSAKNITETFCNVFDFRLYSVNKVVRIIENTGKSENEGNDTFMDHRQFMYIITNSLKILKLDLEEKFKESFAIDSLLAINSLNALLTSKTVENVFTSIVTSYNKGKVNALEKMLSFWIKNDVNNTVSKIIKKEVNNDECDESTRENLFKEYQSILNSFSVSDSSKG